jgi:hypothetical protein
MAEHAFVFSSSFTVSRGKSRFYVKQKLLTCRSTVHKRTVGKCIGMCALHNTRAVLMDALLLCTVAFAAVAPEAGSRALAAHLKFETIYKAARTTSKMFAMTASPTIG